MKIINSILLIFSLVLFSCGRSEQEQNRTSLIELKSPTDSESMAPFLHQDLKGKVYMSWMEFDDSTTHLCYSTLEDQKWSEKKKIASGTNWISNWADFPKITTFSDVELLANYLIETDPENFTYDIQLINSQKNQSTWTEPMTPHKDSTLAEHGFVSFAPYGDSVMVVWLDGRLYASDTAQMTLRAAMLNSQGEIIHEYLIDDRVCDCCPTDMVATNTGISLVYRNRSETEIRDFSIVHFENGNWTEPVTINNDHWNISGCPVNGAAIDSYDESLAVAWFTSAEDTPKVKLVLSNDGGLNFNAPIIINEAKPIGRVDLCYATYGSVFVSWIEENPNETNLMIRQVFENGQIGNPIVVSNTSSERATGFPKMLYLNKKLLLAWTEGGEQKNIKSVILEL